jgi:hypothetical protein
MKKIINFTLLIVITLSVCFSFSSCDKNDKTANTLYNSLQATVNGSTFTAVNTNAQRNTVGTIQQLTIDGTSATGQRITIAVNNFTGATGTFIINGTIGIGAYFSGTGADQIATSGQIIINSKASVADFNGQLFEGSYNFVTNATNITSGTFSVYVHD